MNKELDGAGNGGVGDHKRLVGFAGDEALLLQLEEGKVELEAVSLLETWWTGNVKCISSSVRD